MKINDFAPDEADFTKILTTIADPPKRLWYSGNLPTQHRVAVAIVGSRKPTAYGREVAYRLAKDLAARGVVIISGLALGIDSIAHRGALDAGGTTIAIMPSGLDRIYPAAHRGLAEEIVISGGALLSEYQPGSDLYTINFIARNRIVSGLSDGLVVVEASAKSGTVHTAGFALEQGRAVMAVPGNITSSASEGCHNLLKAGAGLITGVRDILDEIGINSDTAQPALPFAASPAEKVVLDLMGSGIRDGDDLQLRSGLSAAAFGQTVTMLEITGKIRPLGGNQWGLG